MCLKFSFFIKIYDFFFLNEAKTNSFYMDESQESPVLSICCKSMRNRQNLKSVVCTCLLRTFTCQKYVNLFFFSIYFIEVLFEIYFVKI